MIVFLIVLLCIYDPNLKVYFQNFNLYCTISVFLPIKIIVIQVEARLYNGCYEDELARSIN